ncbi:PaaI family thioesterase [Arenibaculum pallidiluteum]|uniref:PaaI family thioesterase n=1 Tax=Arenibaculum pallidiluteum TaxID=2812559 RepID=UPI001A95A394|nr:PaaI family thioesterase [Arenibaculum pallidiluteum]
MSDREDQDAGQPLLGAEPPSGFQGVLGYRLAEWRDGEAVLTMEVGPQHLNRAGVVHGGVYVTLIDTASGFSGCFCTVPGNVRRVLTLSLTTSFLGQASGGVLRAVGSIRGGGRRIFAATAEVFDGDGRLLAIGEGTFRYRSGSENSEGVPLHAD